MVLQKSMYGLVQAARQFYKKFVQVATEKLGFQKCLADGCLLYKKDEVGTIIICLYVDDLLCIGDKKAIEKFKRDIKVFFNTKEEGTFDEYVGCKVIRKGDHTLHMHQPDIVYKIEKEFGEEVKNMRTYKTPGAPGVHVVRPGEEVKKISKESQTRFRIAVGLLLFLIKFTRPDLSNSVRELAKVNDGASDENFKQMLRTIKFVLDTRDKVLVYEPNVRKTDDTIKWEVRGYCDSDFAGDKETRISVSGFCVFVLGCLVSWKSRGQKNVTLSSTEADT